MALVSFNVKYSSVAGSRKNIWFGHFKENKIKKAYVLIFYRQKYNFERKNLYESLSGKSYLDRFISLDNLNSR